MHRFRQRSGLYNRFVLRLHEVVPAGMNDGKHTCQNCDKLAVWHYAPSGGTGNYCDLCVPRGCSCNVIDFDDPSPDAEQHTDDQHRLLPCCEYDYNEDGWDNDL